MLQTVLPFFAVLVALLMVSRIPYPHVVNQVFRGQRSFGHVVAVVFALVAVMVIRGYAVPIVCCCVRAVRPGALLLGEGRPRAGTRKIRCSEGDGS